MARAVCEDESERRRVIAFFRDVRERYMASSSRAHRVPTPPGTGHNFPYEAPDFTADAVRAALHEVALNGVMHHAV